MHKNTWKANERKAAAYFGTRRTPLSGSNSGHNTNSDSLDPKLYIECKARKEMPIVSQFKKVAFDAKKYGCIPMMKLNYAETPEKYLYLFRSSDFKEVWWRLVAISEDINVLCKNVTCLRNAALSLFDDTEIKAKKEGKIPVLWLKEKGGREYLIGVAERDFNDVYSLLIDRGLI